MEGRRREEEKRDGREEEKRDERKEEKRDGRREEEQVTVLTKQPDLCDPPLPPPHPLPPLLSSLWHIPHHLQGCVEAHVTR